MRETQLENAPSAKRPSRVTMELRVFTFQLHNRCASQVSSDCTLGSHKLHVLPPTAICPTVLDRQRSVCKEKSKEKLKRSESCQEIGPESFQISPVDGSQPLLVFVKEQQIYRKYFYHLNHHQVYNLRKGGPKVNNFLDILSFKFTLFASRHIFMVVTFNF